jgi:transposase
LRDWQQFAARAQPCRRDIAWKAQVRLCARYRRMLARRKKAPVVITAIARELIGFMWAIACQVKAK